MPKPFPAEFRADVIAVARKGEAPLRQIAKDFGISEACLHRWLKIADREDGVDRPGFAAAAMVCRQVRTTAQCINPPPGMRQQFRHSGMHARQCFQAVITPSDAGLVGSHAHPESSPVQAGNGLQTAGNRHPLRHCTDVIIGVLIDHPVPVQDHQLHRRQN